MIEKIKNLDDFKEEDSVFFLENLPADSYKTHKVIIDQLNTKILKVQVEGVYELLAHCHLACFADSTRIQILNLTNEETVYEIKVPRGIGIIH